MTTDTTRAEFEAWLSTRKLCKKYGARLDKLTDGQYRDIRVRGHWSTWQAAHALYTTAEAKGE